MPALPADIVTLLFTNSPEPANNARGSHRSSEYVHWSGASPTAT